jgi:cytosolic carboxypeptidase protein 6
MRGAAGIAWMLPAALLAGCATPARRVPAAAALAADWYNAALAAAPACAGAGRRVHAGFERAALAGCSIDSDGHIRVRVAPESRPINPSPWYGFVVASDTPGATRVTLDYGSEKHRYAPWLALPGAAAQRLPAEQLAVAAPRTSASFTLPAAQVQLVIAQPPETLESVLAPFEARVAAGQLMRSIAGYSVARRPLTVYHHRPANPRGTVVIITRQHPPETTGPQAFARFTDILLGPSAAAKAFRRTHALMIVPVANPDGFVLGHWRHNLGGVDLNRDWGPFTQPETRALGAAIAAEARIAPIAAVIDFHSTFRDVVYAPPLPAGPDLGEAMLKAITTDLAGADIRIDRAHNPGNGVLKSWARDQFGVGALTWEVGDDSPTIRTHRLATAAAQALMAGAR